MDFRVSLRCWAVVSAILLAQYAAPAIAAPAVENLKIGTVDFQRVLNLSDAGKRSRKILMASKGNKEGELKAIGERLKKESEALKNNLLLTDAARSKKQKELRQKEIKWRREFRAAEKDLQKKQIKASETIFTEVKTVIGLISKEEKFDFVLESNTARAIIYSRSKMIDITDKVIRRYNILSK